jgi:hypothetical protein
MARPYYAAVKHYHRGYGRFAHIRRAAGEINSQGHEAGMGVIVHELRGP